MLRISFSLVAIAMASLTGCTTPAETRTAISEMNRLCEAEAGTSVYLPEKWKPNVQNWRVAPCPDGDRRAICLVYADDEFYSKSTAQRAFGAQESGVSRVQTSFVSLPEGLLIAKRTSFLGFGANAWLADDSRKAFQCQSSLVNRIQSRVGVAK